MKRKTIFKLNTRGRILSLWLPVAVVVFMFSGVIVYITDTYTRSILSDPNSLPIPSIALSSFKPGDKVRNKQEEFDFLKTQIEKHKGEFSLIIEDLNTNKQYNINPQQQMYAASLYKVPVAVATLNYLKENGLSYTTTQALTYSDFSSGTGVLGKYRAGTKITYRELLEVLLKESDNTAQTMLLRVIPDNYITKGFTLNDTFRWNPEFMPKNETSAYLYSKYLIATYEGNFLNDTDKTFLFDTMKTTAFDDRISPHLTKNAEFSHKIGNWGDAQSWHDCGIVTLRSSGFVVCLMSKSTDFDAFLEVSKASALFVNSLLL